MYVFIFVAKVAVGLALFFGGAISMAIANGMFSALRQETDLAREGRIMTSLDTSYAIREYKRLNPGGKAYVRAFVYFAVGLACLLGLIAWVFSQVHN